MAGDVNSNRYAGFFQRRVVESSRHWQDFVAAHQHDTPALERSRTQILRALSFALSSAAAWPAARHLIESFAPFMERRGYWAAWDDILNQALEAAARFDDTAGQVTLVALLARLRQRQSRYSEVVYLYRRVIRLARRSGNRFEEARACSNLGYLYIDAIGRWQRAEVLCCHALTLFEALGSEHGQAHTENHLGILYTRQRVWEEAEQHLQRACALWQMMGDDLSLMRGFTNLGLIYIKVDYPLKAIAYLEKSFDYAKRTGEEAELGPIWNNMGIAYRQSGDLDKAEAYARQAEAVFRHYSNLLGLAQVWNDLGLVYLYRRKWVNAIRYLEHSLTAYRNLNNQAGEIEALLDLIEYELAQENEAHAALRLNEVETLIKQYARGRQQDDLHERLIKYRHSLTRLKARQTSAMLDG